MPERPIEQLKEETRTRLKEGIDSRGREKWHGKAGEQLRKHPAYNTASTLYISLSKTVTQACINGLNDRKQIILPSPAFKNGFLLLRPENIPFQKRSFAVSTKGMIEHGEKINTADLEKFHIDLAITGAVAVDRRGNRLGDGHGFFDLAIAILNETGALAKDHTCVAIIHRQQIINSTPHAPWDIPMDIIVTPDGITHTEHPDTTAHIHWQELDKKRIKKATPLWDLYCPNE